MARNIGASFVGVIVAMALVWVIEALSHTIYPPPTDLDFNNAEVAAAYIDALPLGALLIVVAAWFIGSAGGTYAACRIGESQPLIFAISVGGAMFVATSMNLLMIPHPVWMSVLGLAGVFAGAWLGMVLGRKHEDAT